jgi:hypothetical protein
MTIGRDECFQVIKAVHDSAADLHVGKALSPTDGPVAPKSAAGFGDTSRPLDG